MKLSIIIPAFNEERTLLKTLQRVEALRIDGVDKEIIIINDGSTDATEKIARDFEKQHNNDVIFRTHPRNKGKGAAVWTGIRTSTGDMIVIQDADLEYHPRDIPRLIKPIMQKNARVVYGSRLKEKPVFFGKNRTPFLMHFFGNKFLSLVTSILYGYSVSDMETGYKAFERSSLKGIRIKARSFDFEPEITAKILKKGIRIHEIKISITPRGYDEGKKIRTFHDGSIALFTLIKYRLRS